MSDEVHNARFLCVPADCSTGKGTTEQGALYVSTQDQMEGLPQYAVC